MYAKALRGHLWCALPAAHTSLVSVDLNNELRRLMDPEYAEKFVASLDPVIQGRVRALQGMQVWCSFSLCLTQNAAPQTL